ncbi:MAG: hypothetical protein SOZ00_05860 [Tidjanibacter sp.]|nr:hypothetical protein [Tidjanibacter sp.]
MCINCFLRQNKKQEICSKERHFWVRETRNSQAEVDFLYNSRRYGLLPVEVKSGSNAHLKSLQLFMQYSPVDTAVRFWSKPMSDTEITLGSGKRYRHFNLPYYYSGELEQFMQNQL